MYMYMYINVPIYNETKYIMRPNAPQCFQMRPNARNCFQMLANAPKFSHSLTHASKMFPTAALCDTCFTLLTYRIYSYASAPKCF